MNKINRGPKILIEKLAVNKNYQLDYSSKHPLLYNEYSRIRKAERMIVLLSQFVDVVKMKNMTVLDIGSSTGIIDMYLAKYFGKVVCIDIDNKALEFARNKFKKKNLQFKMADIMNADFKDNSFDIIVCTHTYEHVPNQDKLFSEIYRILRPGGICYFTAMNKLWIIEPHYKLPFLSWLPKNLADKYVNLLGKSIEYYEKPLSYWALKSITRKFNVMDFTDKIYRHPRKYNYGDSIISRVPFQYFSWLLSPLVKYFSPTFVWLLIKDKR